MRTCTKCGEEKPWEDFYKSSKGLNGRMAQCKSCMSTFYKDRWQTGEAKSRHMERKYGITLADWEALLEECDNRCQACGIAAEATPRGVLVCDHNHETGEVRGALCAECNVGLGMFQDSPEKLAGALRYLRAKGNYGES